MTPIPFTKEDLEKLWEFHEKAKARKGAVPRDMWCGGIGWVLKDGKVVEKNKKKFLKLLKAKWQSFRCGRIKLRR